MALTAEDILAGQVFIIDKPLDWTSFQVVNKMRYLLKKKYNLKKLKVGHAGTLDPKATGVLIVCTGKATKTIQGIQDTHKEYTGAIELGTISGRFDSEGPFTHDVDYSHVTPENIQETKKLFQGEIDQTPPIFSALKKDGKPLYLYARAGEEVEIKSRKVTVLNFEITKIELPFIYFRIACSKGTYIRSIANDFGKALNSGSYLQSLLRTKVGNYHIENAISLDDFIAEYQVED